MIVIIAGMQRSGSTFSFNVAREILDARGGVAIASTDSIEDALGESGVLSNAIVKSHAPDHLTNLFLKKKALKCICTIRKPEDAIASWTRIFGFSLENALAAYKEWLSWHRRMSKFALNISYDEIEKAPLLSVLKIGRYLVNDISIIEVVRIWWRFRKSAVYKATQNLDKNSTNTVDVGFSYYDKKTFFHRKHVSSLKAIHADQVFLPEQIALIHRELSEYVDENGNYNWQVK